MNAARAELARRQERASRLVGRERAAALATVTLVSEALERCGAGTESDEDAAMVARLEADGATWQAREDQRTADLAQQDQRKAEHDARTRERLGMVDGELPPDIRGWLARLDHAPKRDYATAYCRWSVGLGPEPATTGATWEAKARKRADRLFLEAFDAVDAGRAAVDAGEWVLLDEVSADAVDYDPSEVF